MADNIFEILIKYGLDSSKAKEAAAELNKIKDATTAAGKEGVKQEEAVEKATSKTALAKKQFKEAIQGVAAQYPGLAAAARLALNPITLSIAALTTAFVIFKDKLTEAADTFGRTKWKNTEINQAAADWTKYAASVSAAKSATDGLQENLKKISTYLGLIQRLSARSGNPTENNPLFQRRAAETEAQTMEAAAARNRETAAAMRRQAGEVEPGGSRQRDLDTQASLDEEATKSAAKAAALDAEIEHLRNIYSPENKNDLRYTTDRISAAAKYGVFTDPEQMIAALTQQRDAYEKPAGIATKFKQSADTREAQRQTAAALRARADEMDASATDVEKSAREKRFQGQVSFYEQSTARGITPPVRGEATPYGVTPEVKAYFDKANADLEAIGKEWATFMQNMRAQVETQATQNRTQSQRQ